MLVMFLGRSFDGVYQDAQKFFPEEEVLVVVKDNEELPLPQGLTCVSVSAFIAPRDFLVCVIANGGMTEQLIPTLFKLIEACDQGTIALLDVYNIQKGERAQLLVRRTSTALQKQL